MCGKRYRGVINSGVHLTFQADAAEAIWQRRPSAVVVETAVCPEHGAATGNIVAMHTPPSNFFVGMFQGIGRQLSQEPDLTSSHLWQVSSAFSSPLLMQKHSVRGNMASMRLIVCLTGLS